MYVPVHETREYVADCFGSIRTHGQFTARTKHLHSADYKSGQVFFFKSSRRLNQLLYCLLPILEAPFGAKAIARLIAKFGVQLN
jgi:hypothetical protein